MKLISNYYPVAEQVVALAAVVLHGDLADDVARGLIDERRAQG